MNTPDDFYSYAYNYITVIYGGMFAQVLYNLAACVLRALGNSRVPLYFLLLSATLNIALDFLLILGAGMGTEGAALATVISQLISGLLCVLYIRLRVAELRLDISSFRPNLRLMADQIRIGLPMALQFSITSIGTTLVQAALNTLGYLAVAGYSTGAKLMQFVSQSYYAAGSAMSTYCAQNLGAGRGYRIRRGFRSMMLVALLFTASVGTALMFFGKYMTYLFVTEDVGLIIPFVDSFLKHVCPFFIVLSVVIIFRNGIQGMGYAFIPLVGGLCELAGNALIAAIGVRLHSYGAICLSGPTAWFCEMTLLLIYYIHAMRSPRFSKKE